MANPLKVLTQLTASKEAQFQEVVEAQKTVTISGAEAHLRVSGGGEISGSAALKVGGASQLGSSLDVKGAAALSGSLGVVGAANLQSTLGVDGVATFVSDVSASAGLDVVGAAHIGGAFDIDGTLNVDGAASFQSNISGAANLDIGGNGLIAGTLDVDGAVDFDSTLDVAGNITAQASASISGDLDVDGAADVAGNLGVHGNAVIYGNLEVKGVTTTIESTTVTVADANIQLATVASPTDSTADGAGITILGATNKTFQWNNDGHGFTSSEDMNLASGKIYKIDGQEVLAKDGSATKLSFDNGAASISIASNAVSIAGNLDLVDDLHVSGTLAVDGVASFVSDISGAAGLDIAGAAHIAGAVDMDSNLMVGGELTVVSTSNFDGMVSANANLVVLGSSEFVGAVQADSALTVYGTASFQDDVAMDAALNLSGSAFVNITTPVVDGKYNVNDAIRALDAKAGQQASDINSNYNALRYLAAANFDAQGMAAFTSSFAAADIEKVSVDVLVQAGGSGPWTNDLLSVQVKAAGSYVGFEISAPAMGASDKVRIIAVKESGSLA